jgi:hypothetical protein
MVRSKMDSYWKHAGMTELGGVRQFNPNPQLRINCPAGRNFRREDNALPPLSGLRSNENGAESRFNFQCATRETAYPFPPFALSLR